MDFFLYSLISLKPLVSSLSQSHVFFQCFCPVRLSFSSSTAYFFWPPLSFLVFFSQSFPWPPPLTFLVKDIISIGFCSKVQISFFSSTEFCGFLLRCSTFFFALAGLENDVKCAFRVKTPPSGGTVKFRVNVEVHVLKNVLKLGEIIS